MERNRLPKRSLQERRRGVQRSGSRQISLRAVKRVGLFHFPDNDNISDCQYRPSSCKGICRTLANSISFPFRALPYRRPLHLGSCSRSKDMCGLHRLLTKAVGMGWGRGREQQSSFSLPRPCHPDSLRFFILLCSHSQLATLL